MANIVLYRAGDAGAGDPGAGDPGAGDPGAGDPGSNTKGQSHTVHFKCWVNIF